MERIKHFLYLLIVFFLFLTLPIQAESAKVMSLNYDDSSSIVYINVSEKTAEENTPLKYVRLENPNRIYFDIKNSILIGSKQQLVFEKSVIKEIRLAQFSTNPDVVRVVVTFDEEFDTSKIKLLNLNDKILLVVSKPTLFNNYFNTIYDEKANTTPYSGIIANSQVIQKVVSPAGVVDTNSNKNPVQVIDDISKAFSSTAQNTTDVKPDISVVSVDLSSDLKLRTKYFINGFYYKNGGLLISGIGQITTAKKFTLDSPKRVVIDLPNTYVNKKIRNSVVNLCQGETCHDTAKIGQFEFNKARLVVETEHPEKYIPVYSEDAQSLLFINTDKLNHKSLSNNIANIQKAYVKKVDSKTHELILTFTAPVVHSILRDDNFLSVYLFNVKSYNEPELIKTFNNSYYKSMTLSLLPEIGIKSTMKINKDDIIRIDQSIDGKALKFTIIQSDKKSDEKQSSENIDTVKRNPIKNKIVIDPGHGGSDYGAIREGINEKDITLDLSQRVASILKAKGYKVALTRNDDVYLDLQERCDFCETENPEIFVSIHVNSAVATEPYGIETHYYHEHSKKLAEIIQDHLAKDINTKDRGVIKSKFYVINHTDVPAVLVETGFLSNAEERTELITEKRKQDTAKSIAEGIIEYLKNNK